jgi:hypothetical protein
MLRCSRDIRTSYFAVQRSTSEICNTKNVYFLPQLFLKIKQKVKLLLGFKQLSSKPLRYVYVEWEYSFILLNLYTRWKQIVCFTLQPLFIQYPLFRVLGGPRADLDVK